MEIPQNIVLNGGVEPVLPYTTRVEPYETGFVGSVAISDGAVYFFVTEITHSRQSIEAVLEIEVQSKNGRHPPFTQRIDLRSASAIKNLTTELNSAYGGRRDKDGYNWSLILNAFVYELSTRIKESQNAVYVGDTAFKEPSFLLRPFLQENSSNLIFAQSEVGKTWFAIRLALSLAAGKPFFDYPCEGGKKTLYIDYEDSIDTYASRLHKLCRGANVDYKTTTRLMPYYKPSGSFKENIEVIKRMVAKEGIDLIIIDAGGDAAGGSPSDEQKVLELFNSLEEVKCTKLLLHHEPKFVVNEAAAFYGSMYWKARSRVAWRLEAESQDGSVSIVKASIQKKSNIGYLDPFYYKISYDALALEDFKDGNLVPAVILETVLMDATDSTTESLILSALEEHGELSGTQLAQLLGKDRTTVWRVIKTTLAQRVKSVKSGRTMKYVLSTP